MSDTEICNQALSLAGVRTQIASLTENSPSAKACLLFYANTRDALLREAQWNFANTFVTLALRVALPGTPESVAVGGTVWLDTYPAPGWNYEYAYPANCIVTRQVIPQGQWAAFLARAQTIGPWKAVAEFAVPFEISSKSGETVINSNAQQGILCYTRRVENDAQWDPQFREAMVARLAYKIAVPLSGDKTLATGNYTLANNLVAAARAGSGNEGLTMINAIPDWITVRDGLDGGYGPWGWYA